MNYIVIFEDDCEFKSDLHILDSYINEFINILPSFDHKETGKYLDSKM